MTPTDYTLRTGGRCIVCIQTMTVHQNTPYSFLFGDSFMRGVYTHFNIEQNKMGFADLKNYK
jgi:hypothetical protein